MIPKWKFIQKKNYLKAKENTPSFFVYILECLDGSYYTGYTKNLLERMTDHKMGKGSKYVRSKGFKRLIYFETHVDKSSAVKRENEIKKAGKIYKEILVRNFKINLNYFKEDLMG